MNPLPAERSGVGEGFVGGDPRPPQCPPHARIKSAAPTIRIDDTPTSANGQPGSAIPSAAGLGARRREAHPARPARRKNRRGWRATGQGESARASRPAPAPAKRQIGAAAQHAAVQAGGPRRPPRRTPAYALPTLASPAASGKFDGQQHGELKGRTKGRDGPETAAAAKRPALQIKSWPAASPG